jgi:nicotinate-nucleotide--dimethylbenzimidazole phosphoribosyltransferase
MTSLTSLLDAIRVPGPENAVDAQRHLDALTKPPGSLGRLEEIAVRLAALRGGAPSVDRPVVFTFAADHGVVAEGVSAYPQVVTAQMVENFLAGGAAVNVLARHAGARVVVADLGVATPLSASAGLVSRRIGAGTASIARGPAMSRAQALDAIAAGADIAAAEIARGADLLALGEMGIGNTTAASALAAVFTGAAPAEVTGTGTGIEPERWRAKVAVVERALAVNGLGGAADAHRRASEPGARAAAPGPGALDCVDALTRVGGFEIAGLTGVALAGAAHRVPVIVDGFIAGAAALAAVRLVPAVRDHLIAAHRSAEPGHRRVLEALGLAPYLDLGLRLGEGTGAALCIGLARAAAAVLGEMATFKSAGVSDRTADEVDRPAAGPERPS